MRNLSSPGWITLKGLLFLFLGLLSGALVIFENPTLRVALLLMVTIWSMCRFYYFAFYVIEHWIDPNYRFSGLLSLAHYVVRKNRNR
jgi:hypothetical protein